MRISSWPSLELAATRHKQGRHMSTPHWSYAQPTLLVLDEGMGTHAATTYSTPL